MNYDAYTGYLWATGQWADTPFDKKGGDIILRSLDNIYFRLYKGVLANASPVFEDLFTDAQPPSVAGLEVGDEEIDGVPIISLEENSQVLESLLRLYHEPFTPQPIDSDTSVTNICDTLLVARKYFMAYATTKTEELFGEVCKRGDSVLTAYAVACRKKMSKEIHTAAKASLLHATDFEQNPAFDEISGSDTLRLLRYRQKCSAAVSTTVMRRRGKRWQLPWCTEGLLDYYFLKSTGHNAHFSQNYLDRVSSVLSERPHPRTIYDVEHHEELCSDVYRCSPVNTDTRSPFSVHTAGHNNRDIDIFEAEFARAIDAAISQVEFDQV
ncbi:hypothetical protein BC629DRAFT_1051252 [Irpex lacteus]|nr:hypothetical protein BC629DRAFT_1051252 [Irpex lacteus]